LCSPSTSTGATNVEGQAVVVTMQRGGRRPLVAISIRRDVSSLHIHDELALAHDETMGERGLEGNAIICGHRTLVV